MEKQTLFSGIQPTGILHIGNYLGAIKQWVELQEKYNSFFCIVDEHAITVPQDPKELRENTLKTAMMYLAAGIDPKHSAIFVQSHVPAHTELGWILNTMTPLGELERMTQFKDKASIKNDVLLEFMTYATDRLSEQDVLASEIGNLIKNIEKDLEMLKIGGSNQSENLNSLGQRLDIINNILKNQTTKEFGDKTLQIIAALKQRREPLSGILNYPTLMAADILLYKTNAVPVGEDQLQHVELTRSIAERFNNRYGETFVLPKAIVNKAGARIMGLDDPSKKMSKSATSSNNYISLLDSPDEIRRKIKIAVTDSGSEIEYDENKKPAISNLLNIYSLFSGKSSKELEEYYHGKKYSEFKNDLSEVIIKELSPLQSNYAELEKDKKKVLSILNDGKEQAREISEKTLREVKEKIGFLTIP